MHKTTKRFLAIMLAVLMMLSLPAFALIEDDPAHGEIEVVFVEDLLADAEFSAYVMEYLHSRFGEEFFINQEIATETAGLIYDLFPVNRSGDVVYPDSFGGMYIDSDGNLVVLMVEDTSGIMARILCAYVAVARDSDSGIRTVEFSYAELRDAFQVISAFIEANWEDTNCNIIYNIVSVGIDVVGNRLEVYLLDTSPRFLARFKAEVVDHPALVFVQATERITLGHGDDDACDSTEPYYDICEGAQRSGTVVHPGSPIRRNNTAGAGAVGSLGYRARRGTHNGFVTVAHGTLLNDRLYSNGIRLGQVTARAAAVDASFVQLAANVSVSTRNPNAAPDMLINSIIHAQPLVGQVVTRISQGGRVREWYANQAGPQTHPMVSAGAISIAERIVPIPGVGNVHVFSAPYVSKIGDSGGIIVSPYRVGTWRVVGIHVGAQVVNGGIVSLFVHATRINNALGLTMH